MQTIISLSTPAELETESLVAVVLDHAEPAPNLKEKDKKPQLKIASDDSAVQSVAADLLASGEIAGKPFETNLLHKPTSLKAKRLLLISGGSAKKFSSYDLRRMAGVAVRALKSRGIRSFAFVAPPSIAGGRSSARDCGRSARREFRARLLPQRSQRPEDRRANRSRDRRQMQRSKRRPTRRKSSANRKTSRATW